MPLTKIVESKADGWYVYEGRYYLHADGVWRRSTFNHATEEWSGYFKNEEDATRCLRAQGGEYRYER